MNAQRTLTAWVLAAVSLSAAAAQDGVLIQMQLERGGIALASPKVVAEWNKEVSVQQGEEYRIAILPTAQGDLVKMQMTLLAAGPNGLALAGQPALITPFETPASIEWQAADGVPYKVTLTPFKAPLMQNALAAH